jgi:hypothetical protein
MTVHSDTVCLQPPADFGGSMDFGCSRFHTALNFRLAVHTEIGAAYVAFHLPDSVDSG